MLESYIKKWKLDKPKAIASTFTSNVYLANSKFGKVVLKILNDVGVKDEINGTLFLEKCDGNGCARLYEFDERALLIEYLPGENLYQFSKVGSEEKASKVFCEIIKKIRVVKNVDVPNYKTLFDVFDRVKFPNEFKELLDRGEYLVEKLTSSQTEEVLLHGDLHHENIISRSDGEFVCFDPKAFVGDPAYELGTTLKNPRDFPSISHDIDQFQRRASFFSKELNLPIDRVIGFAYVHLCLSIAWSIEDGMDFSHQITLAKTLRVLLN